MMKFIKKEKVTIIICLFLIGILCFINIKVGVDPDYFWHIKAGRFMIEHKMILRSDIFSWVSSVTNAYWMSHEWLFEVLLASLEKIFPKYHVLVYTFSLYGVLLFTLFFINKDKWLKNVLFTLIWFTMSIAFFLPLVLPRPQLFDFIFLALCFYLLYDLKEKEDSKKIYFMPLISLLWANIHGGSSNMPYILTLIFIISGLFNFNCYHLESKRFSKRQFQKYFIVFILCVLAIGINLHGFRMITYPYENMADSLMLKTITEWAPTNFNESYHILFYIFFGINLLVILTSKKKLNFTDLCVLGFTLFLGFKSVRFWVFFSIASFVVICNYMPSYKMKKNDENYIFILIILLITLSFSTYNKSFKNLEEKSVSDKIINYLQKTKPKRLYNYYDYGGYLIYNDIEVFIDGRADLYSKYNYKDSYDLASLNKNFKKVINKYKFDYYLISKDSGLNTYLKYNDNYKFIMSDKKVALYKTKE